MNKNKIYLNLGCGDTAPNTWINCDSSWHAQISKWPLFHKCLVNLNLVGSAHWPPNVKYLSLKKSFPWPNGSVAVVYASHVFEHLNLSTRHNFLKESYRVLEKGGIIRIVIPDLFYHAKKYVDAWSEDMSGAESFLETIHLRLPEERYWIRKFQSFLVGYPNIHKQMYDRVTLAEILIQYGFKEICKSDYGKSEYLSNIKDVECRDYGYEGSLYMEGIKP